MLATHRVVFSTQSSNPANRQSHLRPICAPALGKRTRPVLEADPEIRRLLPCDVGYLKVGLTQSEPKKGAPMQARPVLSLI
jgi:hypothetical protein